MLLHLSDLRWGRTQRKLVVAPACIDLILLTHTQAMVTDKRLDDVPR